MTGSVLCTGNIVLDILTRPVDEITWGGTRWVDSIEQSLGGNGANTSAAMAKLGVPVKLIGGVGRDAFGDAALARLMECGVSIEFISRLDTPTAATVALVRSDGTRAFLHVPGVSRVLFSDPFVLPDGHAHLHIGNPFAIVHLRKLAPRLLREARQMGMTTSVDTAWDALGEWMTVAKPCLPHTGILFTNEDEARMLTGSSDPLTVAARLREAGATNIVMKLGARGCAVFTTEGEWHVPAFNVNAVDTTGAGDCFAGAFLAALHHGRRYPEAARVANAAGALNVQSLGATSGLLSWDETLKWMRSAPVRSG
ncbi:MAG: carbohydrate kinase family protein [Bryobacteraceae bacterium]|nr:carbohydrate kinase family protein [Bryobacteraceae bacterium]